MSDDWVAEVRQALLMMNRLASGCTPGRRVVTLVRGGQVLASGLVLYEGIVVE